MFRSACLLKRKTLGKQCNSNVTMMYNDTTSTTSTTSSAHPQPISAHLSPRPKAFCPRGSLASVLPAGIKMDQDGSSHLQASRHRGTGPGPGLLAWCSHHPSHPDVMLKLEIMLNHVEATLDPPGMELQVLCWIPRVEFFRDKGIL